MICSRCGFINDTLTSDFSCPSCGGLYSSQPKVKQSAPEYSWESDFSKEYPVNSLIISLKEILLKPYVFYSRISADGSILPSWLFALISASIGYTFQFLWSQFLPEQFSNFYNNNTESLFTDQNSSAKTLLFTPLLATIGIWILTFYAQFMLFITKVKRVSIKGTFKVVCYAQSALLFHIIPVFGTILSPIYMCILLLTGLNQKHRAGKLKIFFILILPFFVFFILSLIVLVIFVFLFGITAAGYIDKILPFLNR